VCSLENDVTRGLGNIKVHVQSGPKLRVQPCLVVRCPQVKQSEHNGNDALQQGLQRPTRKSGNGGRPARRVALRGRDEHTAR